MALTRKAIILKDNRQIECITLTNANGMTVEILTLGGIIKCINVPDKDGIIENILLEYEAIDTYISNPGCINALIGRTAGRIHKGQFTLNATTHQVNVNQLGNTLHGGKEGFDKKIWLAKDVSKDDSSAVMLAYTSPNGEEGYPGTLEVEVTYRLTKDNALSISYEAHTDQDTIVNLTNHAYFNLSGNAKRDILGHKLTLYSDAICELDQESIPTGKVLNVAEHSPFNFNVAKFIGENIDADHPQLKFTLGYDHPWLTKDDSENVILYDPISGRRMLLSTNQKAVVVYAMNYANPSRFTNHKENLMRYGICFETQASPIGHNECFLADSILRAGEKYIHHTTFKFDVVK